MVCVVGLDLSLTATGIAVIDGSTVTVSAVTSRPGGDRVQDRADRIRGAAAQIVRHVPRDVDLVAIEAPSLGSRNGLAHERAGLWWAVACRLASVAVPTIEVAPATLKMYALGKGSGGGTDKDAVLAAVVLRYQHHCRVRGNNEADALVLAALAARLLGEPIDDPLPMTHARATKTLRARMRGNTG